MGGELGLTPECLLGSWLVHHSVPWNRDPAAKFMYRAHSLGDMGRGLGAFIALYRGPNMPPRCEAMPSNFTWNIAGYFKSIRVKQLAYVQLASENPKHIYRNEPVVEHLMWCNLFDTLW
jgi:hypothetical protein